MIDSLKENFSIKIHWHRLIIFIALVSLPVLLVFNIPAISMPSINCGGDIGFNTCYNSRFGDNLLVTFVASSLTIFSVSVILLKFKLIDFVIAFSYLVISFYVSLFLIEALSRGANHGGLFNFAPFWIIVVMNIAAFIRTFLIKDIGDNT